MKRRLLVSLTLFILLMTAVFVPGNAYASKDIPTASNKFVNDFANVISAEEEASMSARAEALLNRYGEGVQVMVVTIESLGGESIESYALRMYNMYGIGKKDVNLGVLILVSISDRKTRVATGAGTEEIITDGEATVLAEIGDDYFRKGNFGAGLEAIQIATINELDAEMQRVDNTAGVALPANNNTSSNHLEDSKKNFGEAMKWLGIIVLIAICIGFSVDMSYKLQAAKEELSDEKKYRYNAESNAKYWEGRFDKLAKELGQIEARYKFATEFVDKELDKKIDKKIAEIFDDDIRKIMEMEYAGKDYASLYSAIEWNCKTILERYEKLTTAQKKQVTLIGAFKDFIDKLQREASTAKVRELEEDMRKAVKNKSGYSTLSKLKGRHTTLTYAEKAMFDTALYTMFFTAYKREKSNDEYYNNSRSSSHSQITDDTSWSDSYSYSDSGDGGCSDGGGGSSDW